jgi:ParB family chromosome partitioning protein
MVQPKRPRLGRGLSSLIRSSAEEIAVSTGDGYVPVGPAVSATAAPTAAPASAAAEPPIDGKARGAMLSISAIHPNPHQPRRSFEETALAELAASIRLHGLLQPVVVCPDHQSGQGQYMLIAGERRLRAAQLAGITEVPAIIRTVDPQQLLELALVENIHRQDLNPIERAAAYRELMERFSLSQDQAAQRVGLPRASLANHLRLLELPDEVQAHVRAGAMSFGHAKVLASLAGRPERQLLLAKAVVEDGVSVRTLEEMVLAAGDLTGGVPTADMPTTGNGGGSIPGNGERISSRTPYVMDVERQLTQTIGTKVTIRPGRARHTGKITVEYYNLDDFDKIAKALGATLDS